MTLRDQLLAIAERFAAGRRLSASRVSTLCFGDGKLIDRLRNGSDLTTSRHEKAMAWFSANWPQGAEWPAEIPRPVAIAAEPEVAA